jgi:tricorn protease interacting factor F2/3
MQVTAQAAKTVQEVKQYDLFMDVDFTGLKYNGKVTIDLASTGDINLDAVNLQVISVRSGTRNIPFKQNGSFVEIQSGKFSGSLEVEYKGKVSDNFTGLYKASHGEGYVLSTHLEAVQARKLLPCVDHPAFKAHFKVSVRTDADLSVISNMPIDSEKSEGSKKITSFQKTPKMSTYLLYLGIGKWVEKKDQHGKTQLYSAYAKRSKGEIKMDFAFEAAKKVLDYYEPYFGIPYELPKLHQVAVPEFAYGAMENWGAITYREIRLHVDKDTTIQTKKAVAGVIAHEIAHMWFGDLVTMKWWDDIWLNESFATFMGHKSVDAGYPQWTIWQDFVRTQTAGAQGRDGLKSTHPIEARVRDPAEIEELFDEISYGKGASILRMIEAYIGPDKFQKGVANYLQQFRFSNAAGRDFWTHLQQASGTEVNRIMQAWISQAGYPIVTVSLSNGKLNLEQERFLLAGGIEKQTWPIPVTMTMDGKTQRFLFDKEKSEITLPSNPKSLKLNTDQTGFYLVYYQGKDLQDRVWSSKLSALDKWGLASDAKQFLFSGKMPFKEYLAMVERYQNEQEYLPAYEISDQLWLLYLIAPKRLIETSKRFHSSELKILQTKKDENSSLLRGIVAARLVLLDDAYAKEASSKFKDLASVDPDMKESVVMGYARSTNDYDGLIERYRKSTTDEDRLRYLAGLASFKKPELVGKMLDFALSGNVKRQDIRNVVAFATDNPDAKEVTWQWFKTNVEKLNTMYEGTAQLSGLMRAYVSIIGVGHVSEAESLFNEHPLPGADATLERLKVHDRLARAISAS